MNAFKRRKKRIRLSCIQIDNLLATNIQHPVPYIGNCEDTEIGFKWQIMAEKHAVDDSEELSEGKDESHKRARHDEEGLNVNNVFSQSGIPVIEVQNGAEEQDPRMIPRIGGWNVEEEKSQFEPDSLNIDINGNPEEVEAKVWEILRKGSGKSSEEGPVSSSMTKNASQASATDKILSRRSHTGTPIANTPPPPTRRSRRSAAQKEPVTIEELSQAKTEDSGGIYSQHSFASIHISTLFEEDLATSLPVITQLIERSASVPSFLKPEIIRLLQIKASSSQEEGTSSDSDTQDDGYLKTKAQWAFELGKILDEQIVKGDEITESDDEAERLILMVSSTSSDMEGFDYAFERATKQKANELRSNVGTNPWFNVQGHPFSVIYQMPAQFPTDNSSGRGSFVTQNASQDLFAQQQEMDELREERDRLIKRLEANAEDTKSAKEQSALLKQLYDEASRSNMEAEIECERLKAENEQLREQLSEGMASVRTFSKTRVADLEQKNRELNGQIHLLTEQNRLTSNDIRRKAALWDAAEMKEQERQAELVRRQAKRETERRALQSQILGSEMSNSPVKKPHELFLEVDLEREKIDVDAKIEQEAMEKMRKAEQMQANNEVLDEDDELAALQREAAEYGALDTILDEGDRSRRSRRQRRTPAIVQDASTNVDYLQSNEELAEAIQHNQDQAILSASNEVEDQLGFVNQSADDPFLPNEDQQGLSHVQG